MNTNLKPFFTSKKIVISRGLQPAELVRVFTSSRGIKYARVAFTNHVKYEGTVPMTDIAFRDILAIRKLPTPFKVWFMRLFGRKAKAVSYYINRESSLTKNKFNNG